MLQDFQRNSKAEQLTRISKGQHVICMMHLKLRKKPKCEHILFTHIINHFSVFRTYRDGLTLDGHTLRY